MWVIYDETQETDIKNEPSFKNTNVKCIKSQDFLLSDQESDSQIDCIIFLCYTTFQLLQISQLKLCKGGKLYLSLIHLSEMNDSQLATLKMDIIKSNLSIKIQLDQHGRVAKNNNDEISLEKFKFSLVAVRPSFDTSETISVEQMNLNKSKASNIWLLEDTDYINSDDLLLEQDKVKPIQEEKCGTQTRIKACKDCTCGLAEEDAQGKTQYNKLDTNNVESSCGNCYLGDAFRCSKCPYSGMPSFKKGDKVLLDDV